LGVADVLAAAKIPPAYLVQAFRGLPYWLKKAAKRKQLLKVQKSAMPYVAVTIYASAILRKQL